jgi:hypothetical protein
VSDQLRAGAYLPVSWAVESAELIAARTYTHLALGDRAVIRLVQQGVEVAEDASLEPLGMHATGSSAPVARAQGRAAGFAAWVILNRPEAARVALEATKELEQLAQRARSKPGAAREGYETLGRSLAASYPALLPAFFEDAARAFIASGNPAQASAMFGKAREAERVCSVKFDENQRQRAFLEFAVAGALSAGELEQYAEERTPALPRGRPWALGCRRSPGLPHSISIMRTCGLWKSSCRARPSVAPRLASGKRIAKHSSSWRLTLPRLAAVY